MIEATSGGCPSSKAKCLCNQPEGHDGPHTCNCLGSWNEDGSIVAFPMGAARLLDFYMDQIEGRES